MILFIFAHPDDEAYGPAGTIARLAEDDEVMVVSLCNGERPGSEYVARARTDAFVKSCETLGAKWQLFHNPDCGLVYENAISTIESLININRPTAVYTHSMSDIHKDHRMVAECCLVACRPKPGSTVEELYSCEMTASTAWSFGQVNRNFQPTKFVEVDIDIKKQVLGFYSTETYEFPDARSIEAVEVLAKQRGYQSGCTHAEAFQQIFSRNRRTQ